MSRCFAGGQGAPRPDGADPPGMGPVLVEQAGSWPRLGFVRVSGTREWFPGRSGPGRRGEVRPVRLS